MDSISPFDPAHLEALLGEREWLARLARHLLGEGPDADDLTQETLQRALSSARPWGRARGWLATIARNLLAEQQRGDARRRAREQEAARPEGQDPADPIERAILRRTVLDAVLGLPEPERTAIVLRHLEGLSYAEVAARTGVTDVAARKRASRGIERLRAQLDRGPGGRERWAVALGPLAGRASSPAVSQALSLVAASIMTTQVKLSLTLVALAACTVLALRASDARSPSLPSGTSGMREPVRIARPGQGNPSFANSGPTGGSERLDVARFASLSAFRRRADSEVGSLDLRVFWPDGAPAREVGATILPWGSNDAFLHQRDATTDDHGRAVIDQLASGDVTVVLDRCMGGRAQIVAGGRARMDLTMPPGATVRGRVLDPEGRPVAGAVICLSHGGNPYAGFPVGRSGGDGHYEVRGVSGGPHLSARARGFAPSDQVYAPFVAGTVLELDLALRPGAGSIRGVVRTPEGLPITGARVHLTGPSPPGWKGLDDGLFRVPSPLPFDVRTDERGGFECDEIGAGPVVVEVRAEDRVPARQIVAIPTGGEASVELVLMAGGAVEGVVRHADGTPADRATVSHGDYGRFGTLRARTASDGRYRLTGVPAGRIALRADERNRGEVEVALACQEGVTTRWDATLVEGLTVRGSVVDERGAPLADWSVGLLDPGRWFRTDSEGAFMLTDVDPLARTLAVGPPDREVGLALELPLSLPAREPLRIVVPDARRASAALRLRVLVDGVPAGPSASVVLTQPPFEQERGLQPDARGFVRFDRLRPGACELALESSGRAERRLTCTVQAKEELDLGDVEIPVGGRVRLQLSGAGARACLQAWVLDPSGEKSGWFDLDDGAGTSKLLEPGPIRVRTASFETAMATAATCILDGETVELALEVRPGTVRAVTVRTADGGRIPARCSLRLLGAADELLWRTQTGLRGGDAREEVVYLQGLTLGRYRIVVEACDGRRAEAWLEVSDLVRDLTPAIALVLE